MVSPDKSQVRTGSSVESGSSAVSKENLNMLPQFGTHLDTPGQAQGPRNTGTLGIGDNPSSGGVHGRQESPVGAASLRRQQLRDCMERRIARQRARRAWPMGTVPDHRYDAETHALIATIHDNIHIREGGLSYSPDYTERRKNYLELRMTPLKAPPSPASSSEAGRSTPEGRSPGRRKRRYDTEDEDGYTGETEAHWDPFFLTRSNCSSRAGPEVPNRSRSRLEDDDRRKSIAQEIGRSESLPLVHYIPTGPEERCLLSQREKWRQHYGAEQSSY